MSARPPLRDRGARKIAMLALGLGAVLACVAGGWAGLDVELVRVGVGGCVALSLGALGANVGEHVATGRGKSAP